MLALMPLLRPLIESAFTDDVARYNDLDRTDRALRDHLFGRARPQFPSVLRQRLHELQAGRCFYEPAGALVSVSALAIDHFVPWARHPNNAVENLVLAHSTCNGSKSDLFASPNHLQRWVDQLEHRQDIGSELAPSHLQVHTDLARSLGIARRGYELLPDGHPLWDGREPQGRRTVELSPAVQE